MLDSGRERAVLEREVAGLRQHLRILSEHGGSCGPREPRGIRELLLRAKRRMIGWCRFGSHLSTGRHKGDES
jgi:hypothetical protein